MEEWEGHRGRQYTYMMWDTEKHKKIINLSDLNFLNNIHAKISACSLAENTSINPKQCRKLKLSAKS